MTTKLLEIRSPIPNSRAYRLGECAVIVDRAGGRRHLSISHPTRYPTWDEIKAARYALIPDEATMAMLLPPRSEYVNLHPNCFHLHEVRSGRVVAP